MKKTLLSLKKKPLEDRDAARIRGGIVGGSEVDPPIWFDRD
ncbi:MAG: hypothetical protein QNK37_09200 [Acidobacteriota bacterium]|nr:hypothetical protein [Acidobacteriota bacterium]